MYVYIEKNNLTKRIENIAMFANDFCLSFHYLLSRINS